MHRSHFGSRYTLGCCGYAGLLWGAQFPELAHPCPQGHKDIYAYQVTTVNLGLGWQLLLDHVQTTKADIYHVHSVVLDLGNTPGQQSQCQNTPVARFLEYSFCFWAVCRAFFTIRICGLGLWPYSRRAFPVS